MLSYLTDKELNALGSFPIKKAIPIKLYYVHRGRNAWHSTWVKHYSYECMHLNLVSAKRYAETLREQGAVFYIQELPAVLLTSYPVFVVVTEINTGKVLSGYEGLLDTSSNLKAVSKHFEPSSSKGNSVIRLIGYGKRPKIEKIAMNTRFTSMKSESIGSQYRLDWFKHHNKNLISAKFVLGIIKAIDAGRLYQKGCEYSEQKSYDRALRLYKKALRILPNSIILNYAFSIDYEKKGHLHGSQNDLEKAQKCFLIAGKFEEAANKIYRKTGFQNN